MTGKVPFAFGDSKTRGMIQEFLNAENSLGKIVESKTCTRLINQDEQGLLYVALLKTSEKTLNEKKNKPIGKSIKPRPRNDAPCRKNRIQRSQKV